MSSTREQIGYRLRKLRERLGGLTQESLAYRLEGISRSVLANVESGRQAPSRGLVEALVATLQVNAFWLLFGEGESLRADAIAYRKWQQVPTVEFGADGTSLRTLNPDELPPEPPLPEPDQQHCDRAWSRYEEERGARGTGKEANQENTTSTSDTKSAKSEFALVPFYDVPVSAGAGRSALEGAATYDIAYRREYIHRRGLVAANLIELPVAGDSMSPELESGDTVLVDRSRTNIGGDGIYVIALDGLLYCKRLQLLPGRKLRVISINKDYETYDVQLPEDDGQDGHIEIIGRVVRQGRDR